jgi:hypothetical protein
VCSGATSSARTPFGGGMRHTSSGVSLSSSAGEEERPLDAEACSALSAATAIPVGPGARPVCPFWFADSLAGCRAGPDCPFFHHGQIQLTGRALPRRKDIEAAREAWCRRVLDRGPQAGITASPGQGIHRPGDTETPVAMARAERQAVTLFEGLGGERAAAARAASLAERGDAASETASNGVSSRGGGGAGGAGGADQGGSTGTGASTRRSRRRRSNAPRGGAGGSGGGGGGGDAGSPLRGLSGRRPGAGAPPSPMLQGMGFGGPMHATAATTAASSSGVMGAGSHGMLRSPGTAGGGMGRVLSGEELAAMGLPLSAYAQGAGAAARAIPQHGRGTTSEPPSPYRPAAAPASLDAASYYVHGHGHGLQEGTSYPATLLLVPAGSPEPRSALFGNGGGALPGAGATHGYPPGAAMGASRGGLVSRQSHGELYSSASASSSMLLPAAGSAPGGSSHEPRYAQPHPSGQHQPHPQHYQHPSFSGGPLARVAGSGLPRSGSSGAVMVTTSERPQQHYHHTGYMDVPPPEHATGLVLTAGQLPPGSGPPGSGPAAALQAAPPHASPWAWHEPDTAHQHPHQTQHHLVGASAPVSYGIADSAAFQSTTGKALSTAMSAGMLAHGHGSATALPVVMDTEMELQGTMGHAHASASWAAHSIDAPASRFLHQSGVASASAGHSAVPFQQGHRRPGAESLPRGDEGVASRLGLTSVGSSLGLSTPSVHSGPGSMHGGGPPRLGALGIRAETAFGVAGAPCDDLLGSPDTPGGLLDPTRGLSDPLADVDAAAVPASGLAGGGGLGMLPFGDGTDSLPFGDGNDALSPSPGQRRASVDADDTGLVPFGLLD